MYLFVRLFLSLSVCLFVCSSFCLCFFTCLFIPCSSFFVCSPVCLLICLSVCFLVCWSNCLFFSRSHSREDQLSRVSHSGLQGHRSREGRQVLHAPQHVRLPVFAAEPEQGLVSGGQAVRQLHDRGVRLVLRQQEQNYGRPKPGVPRWVHSPKFKKYILPTFYREMYK